jgi:hypothetical protein
MGWGEGQKANVSHRYVLFNIIMDVLFIFLLLMTSWLLICLYLFLSLFGQFWRYPPHHLEVHGEIEMLTAKWRNENGAATCWRFSAMAKTTLP